MKSTRDKIARPARTVRDWDGKLVRAGTERAARWDVGQPVRPDREVGQRLDGEALEANERKAVISLEKEHSAGPHPDLQWPLAFGRCRASGPLELRLHEAT